MNRKNSTLRELAAELERETELLLISHMNPDGDTIGSMLALGLALERQGKTVFYYNEEELPANLRFLPGAKKILRSLPASLPGTFMFLDCAERERAGDALTEEVLNGKTVLNIDHHVSNNYFGKWNYVSPRAAATGEIVYSLLKRLQAPVCQEIAVNLYTAVVTDTGRFSYSNTTAHSFRVAAALLKTKLPLAEINDRLFEHKSLAQIRLLERTLSKLELLEEGKIALMVLTRRDFEETGAPENLTEGLVNYGRNIAGVEGAVLLKEAEPEVIRVSFRSGGKLDVNQVAELFGGGGHVKAAGCTIYQPWEAAREEVILALKEALRLGWNH